MKTIALLTALLFITVSGCDSDVKDDGVIAATEDSAKKIEPVKKITYPKDEAFQILPDGVAQGDKWAKALDETSIEAQYYSKKGAWKLKADLSDLPVFHAPAYPILAALYNMALEEAKLDILPQKAFMAGKQWEGVWTRDVSYSIHLALAWLFPEISRNTLGVKVSTNNQVIQDTGTGGSWPVSSDRIVWALAAWELCKTTGDVKTAEWAYAILSNTAAKDMAKLFDPRTKLPFGESSFMDWREQSYPLWMQPADIFETRTLSTSFLHANLYNVLASMAQYLGKNQSEMVFWAKKSLEIMEGINRFWLADKKVYSSYLYPLVMGSPQSDKTDNLGEALIAALGPLDKKTGDLVASIPVVHFGVPCIYPQQPHANPYHNKGIWPFVEAYYALAGNRVKNEAAVDLALRSMVRAAALFLTHKENFSYDKGHANDTAINSDRQLWSVAGYLGVVQRVLFGMDIDLDGIRFSPLVPEAVKGPLVLSNFRFRDMNLTVTVTGFGETVKSFLLDGKSNSIATAPFLSSKLSGNHTVEIELEKKITNSKINMVSIKDIAPMETELKVTLSGNGTAALTWKDVKNAAKYVVYRDRKEAATVQTAAWTDPVPVAETAAVYTVQAFDSNGIPANLSGYQFAVPEKTRVITEAEDAEGDVSNVQAKNKGFTGAGYYKSLNTNSDALKFKVSLPSAGTWSIRFRYANGNGPINTDNKCAVRSVRFDKAAPATVVMPQRGKWSDWGYSSYLEVTAAKGEHTVELFYDENDENMNRKVNYAFVDHLEMIRFR